MGGNRPGILTWISNSNCSGRLRYRCSLWESQISGQMKHSQVYELHRAAPKRADLGSYPGSIFESNDLFDLRVTLCFA